jgi:hypothetical protein
LPHGEAIPSFDDHQFIISAAKPDIFGSIQRVKTVAALDALNKAPSTPDFLRVERFVIFAVLLPGIHQFRAFYPPFF